jgi:uncharacterized membrane protein YfcA
MDSDAVIGTFLFVTGLMILVPVLLQLRDGTYELREIRGMFVLVAGFAVVGAGFAFFDGRVQHWLSLIGLGAVLLGLLIQHKRRGRHDAPSAER